MNDFDAHTYLEPRRVRRLDRFSQFAVAASLLHRKREFVVLVLEPRPHLVQHVGRRLRPSDHRLTSIAGLQGHWPRRRALYED